MPRFMIEKKYLKLVERYVQRVNPAQCATAVVAMLDTEQGEKFP